MVNSEEHRAALEAFHDLLDNFDGNQPETEERIETVSGIQGYLTRVKELASEADLPSGLDYSLVLLHRLNLLETIARVVGLQNVTELDQLRFLNMLMSTSSALLEIVQEFRNQLCTSAPDGLRTCWTKMYEAEFDSLMRDHCCPPSIFQRLKPYLLLADHGKAKDPYGNGDEVIPGRKGSSFGAGKSRLWWSFSDLDEENHKP